MAMLVFREDRRQQGLQNFVSSVSASGGGVFDGHVDHRPIRPAFSVGTFIATLILSASHDKAFCEEATVKSIVSMSCSPAVSVIYPAPSPTRQPSNARVVIRHILDRLRIREAVLGVTLPVILNLGVAWKEPCGECSPG